MERVMRWIMQRKYIVIFKNKICNILQIVCSFSKTITYYLTSKRWLYDVPE